MSKRASLWFFFVLVGMVILYKRCTLSEGEILDNDWKYADEATKSEPAEFFLFHSGGAVIKNDTIFRKGIAIAVVEFGYHKYEGTDRLFVRSIASGRTVEYINF